MARVAAQPSSDDEPDPAEASFAEATVVQESEPDSADAEPERKGLDQRTLMQAPLEETDARGIPPWIWAAVIVVVLIVVAVVWMRSRSEPVVPESSVTEAPMPAPAPSVVGIHAWPWGEVVLLQNIDTSEQVEIPDPAASRHEAPVAPMAGGIALMMAARGCGARPGPGHRTGIRRRFACSAFASSMVSTPSARLARMLSGSTTRLRVKVRLKWPTSYSTYTGSRSW